MVTGKLLLRHAEQKGGEGRGREERGRKVSHKETAVATPDAEKQKSLC